MKIVDTNNARRQEALDLIAEHGGIDGSHHKQWLLDQLVRKLSNNYGEWVKEWEKGEDGPRTYHWDEGIAP